MLEGEPAFDTFKNKVQIGFYHGWKFDVPGLCVDLVNEPAETRFKSKVDAVRNE